jgi:signal transduction histidine kinase
VGQLLALLLLAVVAAQALSVAILSDERRVAVAAVRREVALAQLVSVVRLLRVTPPGAEEAVLEAASLPQLRFVVSGRPSLAATEGRRGPERGLARGLGRLLGPDAEEVRVDLRRLPRVVRLEPPEADEPAGAAEAAAVADDDRPRRPGWHGGSGGGRAPPVVALAASVRLPDGRWLNAEARIRPPVTAVALPSLLALLLTAVGVTLAAALSVRRITRPLRGLALAADRLGRGETVEPLPEAGPAEVRGATRAFNEMQARLRRYVDDRTRMLAAIGHDLRTPITTLRLRAELVEDEATRDGLAATLDEMQRMVEATLAFARDESLVEPAREVDLAALVDTLCEDMRELGRDVEFAEGERVVLPLRPVALKRALRNLVENAVAYGTRARVAVSRGWGEAVVTIDDDGPGIPQAQIERVFEPFVRLEESRSRATGGVGLGLAIARSVARAHGGEVTLANRGGGGLQAELRLPLSGGAP